MSAPLPATGPSDGAVVQTLRDGYWERTEVIRLGNGALRVRKALKGADAPGPWCERTLRREVRYMTALPQDAAAYFPALLAWWDDERGLGYEMSYVDGAPDVAAIAGSGDVYQPQANAFQETLGRVVFDILHRRVETQEPLSAHVRDTIEHALAELGNLAEFAPLIEADEVEINGETMSAPAVAAARLLGGGALAALDVAPQVLLHGDLFLENILLPSPGVEPHWPTQLTLIDPVSVAGVFEGHPVFDLVKYESYATGELLAIRSETVVMAGFDGPPRGSYSYELPRDEPLLAPYRRIDWLGRFRAAYVERYGEIDWTAYHIMDAYFALVMALSTSGAHRRARVLKATLALNSAIEGLG